MRLPRPYLGHERDLTIIVATTTQPDEVSAAIGNRREAGRPLDIFAMALAADFGERGRGVDASYIDVVLDSNAAARQGRVERRLQRAIAHDVAERRQIVLRRVESDVSEAAALRDVDRGNRGHRVGARRDLPPDTKALEHKARTVRQRKRAVTSRAASAGSGIQRDDLHFAVAQRKRQSRPDRAGADNDQIQKHRTRLDCRPAANGRLRRSLQRGIYNLHAASTSSIVLGVAAVRFSLPAAVTSTSSSIRTPMFQNSSGLLVTKAISVLQHHTGLERP